MSNANSPALSADFATHPSNLLRAVGHRLRLLLLLFVYAVTANRLYQEYDSMSDIELAELGLNRQDLPRLVAESAGYLYETN